MLNKLLCLCFLVLHSLFISADNIQIDSLFFPMEDAGTEVLGGGLPGRFLNSENRNDLDSALNSSLQSYEMAIKMGDMRNQAILAREIGGHFFNSGEAGLAEYYFEQSLNVAAENKDTVLLLENYIDLGRSLTYQERYLKALEWLLKGQLLAEEFDDDRMIGFYYNSVAAVNLYTGNFEEAIENYQNALDIFTLLRDKEKEVMIKNNIAGAYMEKGEKPNKALEYFSECARYNQDRGKDVWEAFSYNNMATVYYRQDDYRNAEIFFLKALKLLEQRKMNYYVADVYFSLGEVFDAERRHKEAMSYYRKSYNLASEIGSYKVLSDVCERLSEKNEKLGKLNMALKYYQEFKLASDSMENQKSKEALSQLKLSFLHQRNQIELQEKFKVQHELQNSKLLARNKIILILLVSLVVTLALLLVIISLLRKKGKTERDLIKSHSIVQEQKSELEKVIGKFKESEIKLMKLNGSKDKLFSIISHDLITPYSSVISQFEYIIESYNHLSDVERKESIEEIKETFHVNFQLVNNLLEWSRLQTNRITVNLTQLDLQSLVGKVCQVYERVAQKKNITLLNQIEKEAIACADEHMIKTVLLNLVENGIKFSRHDGFVVIGTLIRDNDLVVSVYDNGIGISESNQKKIFKIEEKWTTLGTANEKGSGLGLILCKDFIEKNEGEIWIESFEAKGTTVNFSLPVK